jgi:hypothetical protein
MPRVEALFVPSPALGIGREPLFETGFRRKRNTKPIRLSAKAKRSSSMARLIGPGIYGPCGGFKKGSTLAALLASLDFVNERATL